MMWWERAVAFLGFVSLIGFSVWYTNHVEHASERRQCELVNLQVAVYDEAPPSTAAGVLLAEAYRQLQIDNHC